jgi:hypothetical protein
MGAAFISHHHHLSCTHVNTKGFSSHLDNSSMLAEAHAFHMLLLDASAVNSKSLHIIADSKTLQKIGIGSNTTLGPEHNSTPFSSTVAEILRLLQTFESAHLSHVYSHKKKLTENTVVDLLAGISCANTSFTLCETVSISNHSSLLRDILTHPIPRSCSRIDSVPFITPNSTHNACTICKCPSHSADCCVFSLEAHSFPIASIYSKERPDRPNAFAAQICNPSLIQWDKAPASLGGALFVRFLTICLNDLRHPDRYLPALHAIHMLTATYRIVRGHISRRKSFQGKHSHSLSLDHDAKLARDATIAAEHARNMRYSDALRALHRDEPISPLHPDAASQLHQLYPERVKDPQIPSSPSFSGRQFFDRSSLWTYINSRSTTSSPGISGFGFNWLQYFGRLTIGHETPDNPDPHWTVLLAFIEDLACGELPWLRQWSTSLKGSMFNKTGEMKNIKIRNLGIAETLVRVASHMVTEVSFSFARNKGLIGDFDLGVGVPGGTEKFVKLNQLAAAAGVPIFSADVEKAFNTMLRADIWNTVLYLNCPLLTSWFCFFFHLPPKVFFSADPSSPFNMSNSIEYTLWEGVAQGDPCSSLLFVITLSHILMPFKIKYPNTVLTTVIDDTSLIFSDSSAQLLPSITLDYVDILGRHNLKVNVSKTVVFCSRIPLPFAQNSLPFIVSTDSFTACRRIIGSRSAVATDTDNILADILKAKDFYLKLYSALQTRRVPGRGMIFADIIRLSFRSRWQWAMRTLTPPAAFRIATAADAALSQLLHLLLPHHPPLCLPPSWMHLKTLHQIKIALPLKRGGLGMRSWDSLRHVTHFSSWAEAGSRANLLMTRLNIPLPTNILRDIGDSVSTLSRSLNNPPEFWHFGTSSRRFKIQHHLTRQLDDLDFSKASNLSHDPAVNAHFIGSCLPHMCLPFNSAFTPLADIYSCDEPIFSYSLAFHTMMPLFPTHICNCGEHVDPLGLHFAMCNKLNARNLLHNALRDCFFGALRRFVINSPNHNVALLTSDKWAKSSTYIHTYYPRRDNAPPILERQPHSTKLPPRVAPSKSPDLLIIYADAPLRPMFADFVFASPRLSDNTVHTQAAQAAFNKKRADYAKHHIYPDNTFFPLAAERSGYLHPTFTEFISTFLAMASTSRPTSADTLLLMYSISFAITRMSASLLRAASFHLSPSAVRSLCPPPPLIPPSRWAPGLLLHQPRHRSIGSLTHSGGHQHRRAVVNPSLNAVLTHVISHGTDDVRDRDVEAPNV